MIVKNPVIFNGHSLKVMTPDKKGGLGIIFDIALFKDNFSSLVSNINQWALRVQILWTEDYISQTEIFRTI